MPSVMATAAYRKKSETSELRDPCFELFLKSVCSFSHRSLSPVLLSISHIGLLHYHRPLPLGLAYRRAIEVVNASVLIVEVVALVASLHIPIVTVLHSVATALITVVTALDV